MIHGECHGNIGHARERFGDPRQRPHPADIRERDQQRAFELEFTENTHQFELRTRAGGGNFGFFNE